MASLSYYWQNTIIDYLLRGQTYTPPTTLYIALFTVAPTQAGGGTEVSGGSYARASYAASLTDWAGTQGAGTTAASTGTSGSTSNNVAITFPTPTASWGSIVSAALMDAATGGDFLLVGSLVSPKTVNDGDPAPTFPIGSITWTLA